MVVAFLSYAENNFIPKITMIITKISGGLGNQLFQYAIGKQLAHTQHAALKLDISYYTKRNQADAPRNYKLNRYRINETLVSPTDEDRILGVSFMRPIKRRLYKMGLDLFHWNYFRETTFGFFPSILKIKGDAILDGYWQSENYFPDVRTALLNEINLRDEFVTAPFRSVVKEIQSVNSVAVQIRRGDYVHNTAVNRDFGCCSMEYYKTSIRSMQEQIKDPQFYLFSDDPEWCRSNFKEFDNMQFVNGFEDFQDLILMCNCRHQIIANSSFSWWGAWLNDNTEKVVVAPKLWMKNIESTEDLFPEDWIIL